MATSGLISSNCKNSDNSLSDDPHTVSDERLVAVAKSGDASAFDKLCQRHAQKILHMTLRITRNREDAEDAVQECFLSAFIHLKGFDARSRFSTWLVRIAMNAALMKLRKNRACHEVPAAEPVEISELGLEHRLADPSPNPEERYAKSERAAILRDAVAELRPGIRQAVEIQLQQDCTVDQTAKNLGISLPAAKARMFHARAALRRRLQSSLVAPAIWANSGSNSYAATRVFRRGEGRKQGERPYTSQKAGIQAKGVALEEAQL